MMLPTVGAAMPSHTDYMLPNKRLLPTALRAAVEASVGPAKLNRPSGDGTGIVLAHPGAAPNAAARPGRTPLT